MKKTIVMIILMMASVSAHARIALNGISLNGLKSLNGRPGVNGLAVTNGREGINGRDGVNGIAISNGRGSINGRDAFNSLQAPNAAQNGNPFARLAAQPLTK